MEGSSDDYTISSAKLPANKNNNVILSNSFLGHRLHGDTVHMNGLYNGHTTSCHRARIPCPFPYVTNPASLYTLDCRNATYTVNGGSFCQVFYAHSVLNRVFVTEITVNGDSVSLESHQGKPSTDLKIISSSDEEISPDKKLGEVTVFAAQITDPETKDSPVLKVYCVSSIFAKELSKGHHTFLFAFGYTHNEAVEFYNLAVHYYNNKSLMSSHQNSWDFVWRSVNVDVDNTDFAKTVKSALFFILNAFPHFALENPELENYPFDFYGVSPGSLGNGSDGEDYWGHVFWDQDLWMLPGVMLLFPQLVRQSILYRVAMLPGARKKAKKNGYMGAMYPWESGRTGVDVCPGAIYAKYQQHITACVVYAIRQYVYVTGSWDILTKDGAWDIVKETADYWVSRVEWDGSNFVIDHVMDPDEYHYNVNNSCFTNAAARVNLLFAIEAAEKLGKIPDPRWETVSQEKQGIKIPFDEKLRYHPEYDGYTQGTLIKQASVVLLGYPLGVPMDPDVRKNDIIEYEKCTDRGPGMTYSMYSIGMLELGQLDTAAELFKVQFKNLREPFRIWNEYPGAMGCTNFLTAVGGFLQSLLYGYLGARVFEQFLQVNPNLLPDCSKVTYTGVSYRGEKFDFVISTDGFQVCRTTGNAFELWCIEKDGKKWPLVTNEIVSLDLGLYKICNSNDYEIIY